MFTSASFRSGGCGSKSLVPNHFIIVRGRQAHSGNRQEQEPSQSIICMILSTVISHFLVRSIIIIIITIPRVKHITLSELPISVKAIAKQ
jgi:hypothetical protein